MNQFGGNWTQQKIGMVVKYAQAYLTIMNKYPRFKTIYFDGFAGSGSIYSEEGPDVDIIKGTAIQILEIEQPKRFDSYYFVEKNEKNREELEKLIADRFSDRNYKIVNDDCNNRLESMAKFLQNNPEYRVLVFVDPFGMAVRWEALNHLKGLGIDIWILVPTGVGVNRLLKKNGQISDSWVRRLEIFLGINKDEIVAHFYKTKAVQNLFGEETQLQKETQAVQKAGQLYKERLSSIFDYVSEPLPLRNSTNSIMYHFMMATNNKAALQIANDVSKIKKK